MFNPIDWSLVFSSQFWLGIDRFKGISMADKMILWFGVGMLAVGIIILVYRVVSKNQLLKPSLNQVSTVFITVGLLEMFWFLLRGQFVTALGSRLAAVIVLLIGLGFLYSPLKYFWKHYHQDKETFDKQQLKNKYLQKR